MQLVYHHHDGLTGFPRPARLRAVVACPVVGHGRHFPMWAFLFEDASFAEVPLGGVIPCVTTMYRQHLVPPYTTSGVTHGH